MKQTNQKTYPALAVATPTALVICCGDPRIQEAVHQFLAEELNLEPGQYVPLIVGGGAASLTERWRLPKEFKYLKESLEFYLGHFGSIERVVIINHEDCGKYKALHDKLGPAFLQAWKSMPERQQHDLQKVGQFVAGLVSGKEVVRYYARFANPEKTAIVFEKQ